MIKIGFIGKEEMFEDFDNSNSSENVMLEYLDIKEVYKDYLNYDYIMIRASGNDREKIQHLILNNPHINFIDNINRFFDTLGKLNTSIIRMKEGLGPKTFTNVNSNTDFPIIAKPILGRRCQGIKYLYSYEEYLFWKESDEIYLPEYFFQEKIDLSNEFRTLMFHINGEYKFYTVKKKTVSGIRNHQQVAAPKRRIEQFLKDNRYWKHGIVGFDIGLKSDGSFVIIEENRAPSFNRVQRRLKKCGERVNIPKELLLFIESTN